MSTDKEDLTSLIESIGIKARFAGAQADVILAKYAVIPRDQMPELDESGEASVKWCQAKNKTTPGNRLRLDAAHLLARAEWRESKETRESKFNLSERRNNALKDWRDRTGFVTETHYEDLSRMSVARITVDMVLEAQDGAGK